MSYITKRPEGAPDWLPAAVLCRVRDNPIASWGKEYIKYYHKGDASDIDIYLDIHNKWWRYAEPIDAWQPAEGEIVAAWDDGDTCFIITAYKGKGRYKAHSTAGWGTIADDDCQIDHVARLVYPDGRVIDCACDVEELKRRVGEGNWL